MGGITMDIKMYGTTWCGDCKRAKAFFEKHGFREVGIRKKIGQLHGEWIDNYLFEKNFN